MNELNMFGGPFEVDPILRKLPKYLTDRWRRVVDGWIHEPEEGAQPQYSPFTQFVQFISREARVASGPVVSGPVSAGARNREEERRVFPKQERCARVLLTYTPENPRPKESGQQMQQHRCAVYKGEYPADRCTRFMGMALKERQELVRRQALCGGCLKQGHRWRECRRNHHCAKCDRLHPTLLHDDNLSHRQSLPWTRNPPQIRRLALPLYVTSSEARSGRPKCTHSMLVPVKLKHNNHPALNKTDYVLLDPQSDTCFVKESVLKKMGLSGEEVALEVNTMTGRTISKSQVVQGLMTEDLSGEVGIELPPTYPKEDIPVERQLIPRRDTTTEWTDLQQVVETARVSSRR